MNENNWLIIFESTEDIAIAFVTLLGGGTHWVQKMTD